MPEAAMNEKGEAMFRKNDVRFTGKVFAMEPKAIAHGMQGRANPQLWLRILALNCGHITTALFW